MTDFSEAINRSTSWLLAQQQENGGWGEQGGRYSNAMNTAEAIIGLIQADVQAARYESTAIQNAVAYLLRHQASEGADAGAWPREIHEGPDVDAVHVPDVCRTAVCLQAIIMAGQRPDSAEAARATAWLLEVRNNDGGWGFGPSPPSTVLPTCRVLMALIEATRAGWLDESQCVREGIAYLTARQDTEGAFADGRLAAAHTVLSIMVLQRLRRAPDGAVTEDEARGMQWIRTHPDEVLQKVEEKVALDYDRPEVNYEFVHAVDALTLRVLADSSNPVDTTLDLWRDAANSLKDRMDHRGAFFGFRTYSWSTAQGMSGLKAAQDQGITAFPQRRPEPIEAAEPRPDRAADSLGFRVLAIAAVSVFIIGPLLVAARIGGPGLVIVLALFEIAVMAFALVVTGQLTGADYADVAKQALAGLSPGGKKDQ